MSTQNMPRLIAEYFKTQPVLKAWLFGSYSRDEQMLFPWVTDSINHDKILIYERAA